jgi:hypothetical protein
MFESLIPRGKMGRPKEIASAALFLASDDSSYVNGVELSVDGVGQRWHDGTRTCCIGRSEHSAFTSE